jgi:selenocysteine-specific elongation factor
VRAVLERRASLGADRALLARESGCAAGELETAIAELIEEGAAREVGRHVVVSRDGYAEAGEILRRHLEDYHRREPLSWGFPKSELKKKVEARAPGDLVEAWVQEEIAAGRLHSRNDRLRSGGARLELTPDQARLREAILEEIRTSGFSGRRHKEALTAVAGSGSGKDAEALLLLLIDAGDVRRIPPDFYFAREHLDALERQVRGFFADRAEMRVGDLKEILGVSRKQAVPLLEYLDQSRLTLRRGDVRLPGPKLKQGDA